MNIVLFGPPGAGKGTQAVKLAEKFNYIHLSTGDIFRKNIKENTELGKLANSFMAKGELVPDEVTIKMLEDAANENPDANGIIFDGFPRTIAQAKALDSFLQAKRNQKVDKMLSLEVDDDELIKRLLERGMTSGRPDDADEGIIRDRIKVYNKNTAPLKNFYMQQGKCVEIIGVGGIDSIFKRLASELA
jgi:adenylate kinase